MKLQKFLGILGIWLVGGAFAESVGVTSDIVEYMNALAAKQNADVNEVKNAISDLAEKTNSYLTKLSNSLITELQDLFKGYLGVYDFNNMEVSYVKDSDGEKMSHLRAILKGLNQDHYAYVKTIPAGGNIIQLSTGKVNTETKLAETLTDDVNQAKNDIINQAIINDLESWPAAAPLVQELKGINYNNLIGLEGYDEKGEEGKKARSFITELLKTSPPLKEISFKDNAIVIPLEDENSNDETTFNFTLLGDYPSTQYKEAVDYLKEQSYYKDYHKKAVKMSKLRSVYVETFANAYQERMRKEVDEVNRSLAEREKEMADRGLSQEYYDEMKTKSASEVNLEILYAINKVAYFLHRLHKDNERSSILLAATALQFSGRGVTDENNYLNPMVTLIKNKCWLKSNADLEVCKNPQAATAMDTGVTIDDSTREMFE